VRWRWTTSLAALIHFLQQRLEEDAQYEIQEYAQGVRNITQPLFPAVFEATGL
jgi:thymidylate synthase (FAD)